MMLFSEDAHTALKEECTEKVKKEIIAFLNSDGGTLYIGVDDSGNLVGLPDADNTRISVDNVISSGIYPSAVSLATTSIVTDTATGKQYVECIISEGIDKPYHVKNSRLTPDSVFIRVGSSSVAADYEIIEQLLRSSRNSYESLVSLSQDLSFAYADKVFQEAGVLFGDAQKISLKVKTNNGLYTNLGLLLSDQCPHIIKAAAFADEVGYSFKSRNDFVGSIFMQIDNAYDFAMNHNEMSSYYRELKRIDRYKFPPIAIREALLNAVMHRDYNSPSPTQFKIFSDRIEIISFGGLTPELDEHSLGTDISSCRNPYLANILAKLHYVEAFGTGIPKIMAEYKDSNNKPKLSVKPNLFIITLPAKI